MYCLQWLLPLLLIPKPANPFLLQNHSMFMTLYLASFFLERRPCTICTIVFVAAIALMCYSGLGNCFFFLECEDNTWLFCMAMKHTFNKDRIIALIYAQNNSLEQWFQSWSGRNEMVQKNMVPCGSDDKTQLIYSINILRSTNGIITTWTFHEPNWITVFYHLNSCSNQATIKTEEITCYVFQSWHLEIIPGDILTDEIGS